MCRTSPLASHALLQRHICGSLRFRGSLLASSNTTTPALRHWVHCWFAEGRTSLQQCGLLSVKVGFSFARNFSFTCSAEMSVSLVIVACFAVSLWVRTAVSCDRASHSDAPFMHSTRASPRFKFSGTPSSFQQTLALLFLTLTWLRASWSAGTASTQTCAQRSTGLLVWWSLHALYVF